MLLVALLPGCFSDPGPQEQSSTSTTGPDPTTSTTAVTCSDGLQQAPVEDCDKGPLNGDFAMCREDCKFSFCGDGFAGPTEECDDGDGVDDNGCRNNCTFARCGDEVVFKDREVCDDGNLMDDDDCSSLCKVPVCGDGAVNPNNEECDWGELNADDAGCTAQCKLAMCGDNLRGPGELCDDSMNGDCVDCTLVSCNNMVYDEPEECDGEPDCTPKCTKHECGDRIVGPDEECDDGNPFDDDDCNSACRKVECGDGKFVEGEVCEDENMEAGDGCFACERDAYFVFVTDQTFSAALGGLATADQHCQAAAGAAGLMGSYRAWLSDSFESPATRFARSSRPYILPGTPPVVIANSWVELVGGTLQHAVDRTAAGVTITSSSSCEKTLSMAWSHTKATGGAFKDNPCSDWVLESEEGTAVAGLIGQSGLSWTEGCPAVPCGKQLRLYCVEQPSG